MNRIGPHSRRPSPLLAAFLGLLFLALSSVRVWGDAGSAAFGGPVINAAVGESILGTRLGSNLILFAAALTILHVLFGLVCWTLAFLSQKAWPASPHSGNTWLLLWFVMGASWLLIANAALFPWSSLGSVYYEFVQSQWFGVSIFDAYSTVLVSALLWLLMSAFRQLRPASWIAVRRIPVYLAAACIGFISFALSIDAGTPRSSQPHVILIGIDSLRTDAVETAAGGTPALDSFLGSAVRFTDATTPLARTFPSWVSLISGKSPHTTGAIINLLPRDLIHTGETLPTLLSRDQYTSVYAIDEVRFSNLDLSYGFDRMITPPIGATDFIVGFFGDTPLSNLLVNTRIGALFFPYLYGNRAAAHVYDPDTFVERLDRELEFDQPTFLAVHLTLPHWPYSWADAPIEFQEPNDGTVRRFYQAAVERVDSQFGQLMQMLKRKGALENAIVILISDHGESLGQIGSSSSEARDHSLGVTYEDAYLVGHGTSVFAPHQYQVLLAMRSFGNSLIPDSKDRIDAPVSLEDVTPTVLDLLSVHSNGDFDGCSLTPLLSHQTGDVGFTNRIRFTETEFNPKGFAPGAVVSASALEEAAAYYRVDPQSDRVLVRTELLERVLEERQFAAFFGNQMLAVVPIQTDRGMTRRSILVERGHRPRAIDDPDRDEDAQVKRLWDALNARYPSLRLLPAAPALNPEAVIP